MAAHGLDERRATLTRLKTINNGLAWQGSVWDDYELPRSASGRIAAHAIIDFGAPVKTARDRNLANREKGQPHILPANVAIVAGTPDDAQALMAEVFNLLVDWSPSVTADSWEAKGGYGTRRPGTNATPVRYVEGLFLECVVNQGISQP